MNLLTPEWQRLLADEPRSTTISHQDGPSSVRYGAPLYYIGMYILYIGTALVFPQEKLHEFRTWVLKFRLQVRQQSSNPALDS